MLKTALYDLHQELGAKFGPFAGYSMPIQYPKGIIEEHHQCRERAALFDVSHMGVIEITGSDAARRLETILPADLLNLNAGKAKLTFFTNENAGILDDLIVTATQTGFFTVVNAGNKDADLGLIRKAFEGSNAQAVLRSDMSILALQGPESVAVMEKLAPEALQMSFMESALYNLSGIEARVSRLGYTGEDGFEIAVHEDHALKLARTLLAFEEVEPAGLGARDSLRLEAGLLLHGQDMDAGTSPIEAGLRWAISKRRRSEGGYPGAEIIKKQIENGPSRNFHGMKVLGRMPARAGAQILAKDGRKLGTVTSGTFSPTLKAPLCLGYLEGNVKAGDLVDISVRNKNIEAEISPLPFVTHRYHRQ